MTITHTHWRTDGGKIWATRHAKWTGDASDRVELEAIRARQIRPGMDGWVSDVTELPDGTLELTFRERENQGG